LSQLQVFLDQLEGHDRNSKTEKINVSSISNAVTTILERYKRKALKTNRNQHFQDLRWLDFPDMEWKQEFDKIYIGQEQDDERLQEIDQESVGMLPSKLQKRSEHRCQDLILMLQRHLITSSQSFERQWQQQQSIWWRFSTCPLASELLDEVRLHYFAFSSKQYKEENKKIRPSFEELEQYMRTMLPFKLHEEWFQSSRRESKRTGEAKRNITENIVTNPPKRHQRAARLRLMIALSKFALQTGFLPLAAQEFILVKVLPTSNNFMDSKMGTLFLSRVLPFVLLKGTRDKFRNEAARDNAYCHRKRFSMHLMLQHLGWFFLYGDASSRYKIVTVTLTPLFSNLGRLDSSSCRAISGLDERKSETMHKLKAFTRWIEDLLLKGSLSSGDNNESLCAAAEHFYSALCCFLEYQHEDPNLAELLSMRMILPNNFLIYRMLLSSSAVHIDRLCNMLSRYSKIIENWKRRIATLKEDQASSNAFGIMQQRVFDCLLWDVSSTLWRNQPYLALNTGNVGRNVKYAREMSILYTDIRPEAQEALMNSVQPHSLNITHGVAFAEYIFGFIQTHGEELGVSFPDEIVDKQKERYLDYLLQSCGLNGIYNFLMAFRDLFET
jgi:hypothetical protein